MLTLGRVKALSTCIFLGCIHPLIFSLSSTGVAPVSVQPCRPVRQREQCCGHAPCHHPGQPTSRQQPGRDLQWAARLQGPQMVKASSGPPGPQDAGGHVTCAARALCSHGGSAQGVGNQPPAWTLTQCGPLVSTCSGLTLSHRASFSFLPPQPLHNWHHEPGYLFYPEPAASPQLQVRDCFWGTCMGLVLLPGILPSPTHFILMATSLGKFILLMGRPGLRESTHVRSHSRSVAEWRREPRSP